MKRGILYMKIPPYFFCWVNREYDKSALFIGKPVDLKEVTPPFENSFFLKFFSKPPRKKNKIVHYNMHINTQASFDLEPYLLGFTQYLVLPSSIEKIQALHFLEKQLIFLLFLFFLISYYFLLFPFPFIILLSYY